jgi:hypothetical protein
MKQRYLLSHLLSISSSVVVLGALPGGLTPARLVPAPVARVTYRISEGRLASAIRALTDDDHDRVETRNRLRDGAAGTYIDDILLARDSSLSRWHVGGKPLKVWIKPTSTIQDFTPDYVVRVRQAFQQWETVGTGLHFAFEPDSSRADVHITWTDRFQEPISGRTRWARDSDWWIVDASIVLAVHHHEGETLDCDAMGAIALHEVGHLIGLDHTADPDAIMSPKVRVRALTPADRATAHLLYTLTPGPVR